MSDLISKQAAREALLKKGQSSKRYKLGERWELNWFEIEDALSSIPIMETEPVKHGELLAKIKDLIAKYKQAESGMIWETSGSIEEDEEKLEIECKELRKYFEKALGGADE